MIRVMIPATQYAGMYGSEGVEIIIRHVHDRDPINITIIILHGWVRDICSEKDERMKSEHEQYFTYVPAVLLTLGTVEAVGDVSAQNSEVNRIDNSHKLHMYLVLSDQ